MYNRVESQWWHKQLMNHKQAGDRHTRDEDVGRAEASFKRSLEVWRSLSTHERGEYEWPPVLAPSYQKLSDVQLSLSDVSGALRSCRTARDLAEPGSLGLGSCEWLRDLSNSYWSIAAAQLSSGDRAGASVTYEESLHVCELLVSIEPSNPTWKRGLAFAYEKLGMVQMALDDFGGAMTSFERTLEIAEGLCASDTTDPLGRREVAVSHEKIGDAYYAQGDWQGVLGAQLAGLQVRKQIVADNPYSEQAQRDLIVSFEKLVAVAQTMGDPQMKASYRRQSLETIRAMRANGLDIDPDLRRLERGAQELDEAATLERDSFARFCSQLGHDPVEHARRVLRVSQDNLRRLIEVERERFPELAEQHQTLVQELLDADDYWLFKRLQNERTKEGIVRHIGDNAALVPIDYEYLSRICEQLHVLAPGPGEPGSLKLFLETIPSLTLSELEFNAFVERRTLVGNAIPCVGVSEQLVTATDVFFDVVFRASTSRPSGAIDAAGESQCTARGSDPGFQEACKSSIDLVLGRTDNVDLDYERLLRSDPVMSLPFQLMSSGAHNFVWYHEYGHLLMGHLPIGPCPEVEFEADVFAWQLVNKHVDQGTMPAFWNALGAMALISLFEIIEAIAGRPQAATHPEARLRLKRLMRTLNENDRSTMYRFIQSMIWTCNPTLLRSWGVSIDRYEELDSD